jgi:predicted Zn-dependent protease
MGPYADPTLDVIALIHELAHIFGAEHVDDRASIMHEDLGYRTEFDDKNRSIVQKNKLCPFAKG